MAMTPVVMILYSLLVAVADGHAPVVMILYSLLVAVADGHDACRNDLVLLVSSSG